MRDISHNQHSFGQGICICKCCGTPTVYGGAPCSICQSEDFLITDLDSQYVRRKRKDGKWSDVLQNYFSKEQVDLMLQNAEQHKNTDWQMKQKQQDDTTEYRSRFYSDQYDNDNPNNDIYCPKCKSHQYQAAPRGYSLLWGFIGSGKIMITCLNCGHRWKPGSQ